MSCAGQWMFWGNFPEPVSPSLSCSSRRPSSPATFLILHTLSSILWQTTILALKAGRELGLFPLLPAFYNNVFGWVWGCRTSSLKYLSFFLSSPVRSSPEQWWQLKHSLLPLCSHTSSVCCFEHSEWVTFAFVILGSSPSRNHITTLSSGRAGIATKNRIHYNNIQQTKPENSGQRPP